MRRLVLLPVLLLSLLYCGTPTYADQEIVDVLSEIATQLDQASEKQQAISSALEVTSTKLVEVSTVLDEIAMARLPSIESQVTRLEGSYRASMAAMERKVTMLYGAVGVVLILAVIGIFT